MNIRIWHGEGYGSVKTRILHTLNETCHSVKVKGVYMCERNIPAVRHYLQNHADLAHMKMDEYGNTVLHQAAFILLNRTRNMLVKANERSSFNWDV